MIQKNIENNLPRGKIAKVTISIPEGEKIAKKTMNPKLGIVGGISVLGTTGIARSMSSDAYKNSIVAQLDVAIASDISDLVFVPGNIGEKLALKQLNVSKAQIIQTGNFVGFMFEEAEKRGIKKFTFFGHLGKLVKITGGIFDTKHAVADGRREIMITHAALCGCDLEHIKRLYDSKTTEDMTQPKTCPSASSPGVRARCKIRRNVPPPGTPAFSGPTRPSSLAKGGRPHRKRPAENAFSDLSLYR